ncbi:MAG: trypsin-like peptidase domain-containing protein [Candidatus Obscuribacterales bacterium]|nr:trypsin-like peptidase domain-containing protein [Cyanobacteria bacterium HKST-UBA01]MCB9471794.1 trypsin-like peptidase domain-containing protein [Candidatus Obscuribacterales bacterium]
MLQRRKQSIYNAVVFGVLSLAALGSLTRPNPVVDGALAHESSSHLNLAPETKSPSSQAAVLFQGNLIADIAEKAAPAVVKLEVDRSRDMKAGSGSPSIDPIISQIMPGFKDFNMFFNRYQIRKNGVFPFMPNTHNSGSGFIVRNDGYIVTNAHVVKDAAKIEVRLNDKSVYQAKIVGSDSFSDLAVLKIDAKDLPTLKLGSSNKLRPGEFVIAIGSPLGYDHSVTLGIISAVERTVTDINGNINFIQTDAAINRGNSGGPLINLNGEVIGVNTAFQGNGQSIGFSIPADVARSVTDDLIANRKILRPYLGIGMEAPSEVVLKSLGLPLDSRGVFIKRIYEESPAEKAGLKSQDLIRKIEGEIVESPQDVQKIVKAHKVGEELNFLITRDKSDISCVVKIGEYPDQSVLNAE